MNLITLNNGSVIPQLGLGTYKMGDDATVYNAVRTAIDAGYRHIDTAAFYQNEAPIGKAIRESGIAREEFFVTTKLWGEDILSNQIEKAFDRSLQALDLGYMDLYLVHWPVKGQVASTWEVMEKLYAEGNTKAIGVSNHLQHHLEEILGRASVKPVVNQIEHHPYLTSDALVQWCADQQIVCQAWSPLASTKAPLLEESVLSELGEKYGKSAAQIVLRWNIQYGVITIPKSVTPSRIAENIDIFDFELTAEDMAAVHGLNGDRRLGIHPDEIRF